MPSNDSKTPQTGVLLWGDRNAPVSLVVEQTKAIAASGVADYLAMSDQLVNFIPPSLWKPEIAPIAELLPDPDSMSDPFVLAAHAISAAPDLGVAILCDAVRHGPAQLIHMMMTLATVTEGKALFLVGAGEIKNINPFGWKRSQGLARMEDLYRMFDAIWESAGPVSLEGNHWTFRNAFLGGAKTHRPQVMGLGGGPKLIDLATTFADGFAAAAPCTWPTAEACGEHIERIRRTLEEKDRDPDDYTYGIFCPVLVHEDENVMDRALENELVRWIAAIFGRINPADWPQSGLESPVPDGWTYYLKMRPHATRPEFVEDVVAQTTRGHTESGYIWGTPEQVADKLQAYVDVGVNWIGPVDYMPMVVDPEDGAKSLDRTLEVCRLLKRVETPAAA